MTGFRNVSPVEAVELVDSGALLVDVREQHEWDAGHAPVATHAPMSRISETVGDLPQDRTIVCVCHVGGRSAAVADALARAGWPDVVNVAGGMEAWAAAGLDVVSADGRPGTVV